MMKVTPEPSAGLPRDDNLGGCCVLGDKPGDDSGRLETMPVYFVYIMASRSRTLYTGVTNDLVRRVNEHKHGHIPGFTMKYRVTRLVYYEATPSISVAIGREKQIKAWRREKKVALIEATNPCWDDLSTPAPESSPQRVDP